MSTEQLQPDTTTTPGGMFLRRSSGLVREFSAKDTLLFNLVAFAPALSIALIPLSLALTVPNVNVFALIAVAVVFAIFNGLMYAYLSATMPRSGVNMCSSVVRSARSSGSRRAGVTWSQILGMAFYATFTVTFAIGTSFFILGAVLGSSTLTTWSATIGDHWPTFFIATGLVLCVAVVLTLGPRVVKRILNILAIPAIIGSVVTLVVLATTSHAGFITRFDAFMARHGHGQTYHSIMQAAAKAGYIEKAHTFGALVSAMPIAAFFFIGFTYSVYIGGEVKEPGKTQPRMIMLALALCATLYIANLGFFYHAVGQDFYNAFVYLSGTATGTGLPATVSAVINLFSGMMTNSSVLNVLMAISFFTWPFLLLFAIAMVCSRNLFAWSFDRILPSALTKVDRRFSSPWIATLVIVVGVELLIAVYVFTTFFQNITNYTAIFSVAFWLASWAAIVLPYRRRELFAAAPASARRTVAGVPVMVLLGIGNLVLYTLSLIGVFKFPAFSGPAGGSAILFVVAIYASGVVIYLVSTQLQKRRGVDLSLIYKEIPPE